MALESSEGKQPRPPKRRPGKTASGGNSIFKIVRASEVVPTKVTWLWERYIPRGMITMLTGDPQAGKSTLVCEILSAISAGRALPGEDVPKEPETSWLLSSEDEAGTTIIWRLKNQQADIARVLITDEKVELTEQALKELEALILREKFTIVVIDTLTTWMGGDVDMNSATQSMSWLEKFKGIAQRTRSAFLFLRHKRKGPTQNDLYAGSGSIGFTAAARSELMVKVDKNGVRTLERTKGNIGKAPPKITYTIDDNSDPTNVHGILRWHSTVPSGIRVGLQASAALDLIPDEGTTLKAWREACYAEKISKGNNKDSLRKAFIRVKDQLLKAGRIVIDEKGFVRKAGDEKAS